MNEITIQLPDLDLYSPWVLVSLIVKYLVIGILVARHYINKVAKGGKLNAEDRAMYTVFIGLPVIIAWPAIVIGDWFIRTLVYLLTHGIGS